MTTLTPETLAELRRLARSVAITVHTPWYRADELLAAAVESEDDAAYIAALPPNTVLELLDAAAELAHMTEARDNARAEVERLSAQVEAVREMRAPYCPGGYPYCAACDGEFTPYPCPTICALDATPGGES